jgi:hypothetical protein
VNRTIISSHRAGFTLTHFFFNELIKNKKRN